MPRSAEANQRIKDERREHVLEVSRGLFARKGLSATKMSDIATAADVSYGLVYHYFPNKEAIYQALVERALDGALRLTEAALTDAGTPAARLLTMCERMLMGLRGDSSYTLLVIEGGTNEAVPAKLRKIVREKGAQTFKNMVRLIELGQAEGELHEGNPRELAMAFFAAVQGLSLPHPLADSLGDVFPSAAMLMRLLLRPAGGAKPARRK